MGKLIGLCKNLLSIGCSLIMIGWFSGCNNGDKIIFDASTNILQQPYPLDYPSSKPMPNKVIAVLHKGDEAQVINHIYGKDYLAYKIRLVDDRIGYVMYRKDAFRIMSAPEKR